jgi:hypothetical protein
MRLVSVVGGQAEWSKGVAGQPDSTGPKANTTTSTSVTVEGSGG